MLPCHWMSCIDYPPSLPQPFWNMSKRVLVEKSPRHTIMTRFLQALATPEASRFLIIMRHPLAASHYQWSEAVQLLTVLARRHELCATACLSSCNIPGLC